LGVREHEALGGGGDVARAGVHRMDGTAERDGDVAGRTVEPDFAAEALRLKIKSGEMAHLHIFLIFCCDPTIEFFFYFLLT
jgi:hypothetical protein